MATQQQMQRARTALNRLGVTIKGDTEAGGFFASVPFVAINMADYQRDAIRTHVAKIAADFNITMARPLALSFRDGLLWCYDGRQTMSAMDLNGYTCHDAMILVGQTYQQEALYFFTLNDVPRKMASWKKFSAAQKAGNVAHMRILERCAVHHLTTPLDPGVQRLSNADIQASRPLLECYAKGSTPLLDKFLAVLDKSWRLPGVGRQGVMEAAKKIEIQRGLIAFLHENASLPMNLIIPALRSTPPDQVRTIAMGMPSKGRIDEKQFKAAFNQILTDRQRAA